MEDVWSIQGDQDSQMYFNCLPVATSLTLQACQSAVLLIKLCTDFDLWFCHQLITQSHTQAWKVVPWEVSRSLLGIRWRLFLCRLISKCRRRCCRGVYRDWRLKPLLCRCYPIIVGILAELLGGWLYGALEHRLLAAALCNVKSRVY